MHNKQIKKKHTLTNIKDNTSEATKIEKGF